MAFRLEQNLDGGSKVVADAASANEQLVVEFADGVDVTIGRGDTDTAITFIALRNTDGELCYITGNATQDAVVVSGTKP